MSAMRCTTSVEIRVWFRFPVPWSGSLSAELVDGTAALRFGEAFERGYVELGLDLFGRDIVLSCEVEEVFDLLRRRRCIGGRAILLVVGGFRGVLRRGVVQPRFEMPDCPASPVARFREVRLRRIPGRDRKFRGSSRSAVPA